MNKTKKKCIFVLLGFLVLMMTAASVNADEDGVPSILDRIDIDPNTIAENETDDSISTGEEPNLISPSPNIDEESLIIAPRDIKQNENALSGDNTFTTGLILIIGISGIAGLAAALIILKNKN